MNVNEEQYIGRPSEEVPTQEPTDQHCMAKRTERREDVTVFVGYCRAWPGKGTDHVGDGRCSNHGGSTPRGEDSPHFEHGLFSDYLDEEDRYAIKGLEEMDDDEKLEDLINWRLARLRRAVKAMHDPGDQRTFWEAFDEVVQKAEPIEDEEIKELARMLDKGNRAMQNEIDLIRKLIKDHIEVAEGEDVNLGWRQMLAGGGDDE